MTLEQSLWADVLDNFVHGNKRDYLAAQRRYDRFMRARKPKNNGSTRR